jgi:hypothetical protein
MLCKKLPTPFFEVYKTYLKTGITKCKPVKISHIGLKYSVKVYGIHKIVRPYVNQALLWIIMTINRTCPMFFWNYNRICKNILWDRGNFHL